MLAWRLLNTLGAEFWGEAARALPDILSSDVPKERAVKGAHFECAPGTAI
jgi:hypothetical protein